MSRRSGRRNQDWETPCEDFTWQHVQVELLMDLRDELRKLNETLACYRVRRMSDDINKIDRRLQRHGLLLRSRRKV